MQRFDSEEIEQQSMAYPAIIFEEKVEEEGKQSEVDSYTSEPTVEINNLETLPEL